MFSTPLFTTFVAGATVLSHIFFILIVVSWWKKTSLYTYISQHALGLSFVVALVGTLGSLTYSNIIGFEPCTLCWIQRIFLFSQVVILGVAFVRSDRGVLLYGAWLSVFGAAVAVYQWFYQITGISFIECTAVGGDCSRIYVQEFEYVTIPLMSLTVFSYLIIIFMISKKQYVTS